MIQDAEAPPVVTHIISGDIWAGAEAQVFQLVEGLKENSVVIPTAVVFNPGLLMDKLVESGIAVTCAEESRLGPLGIVRVISAHIRENQSRIIHTHGFKENVLGTFAQKLNCVPKSVRTVHGNPEGAASWRQPKRKLIRILDELIGRFGQDAIIAVSSELEARLLPAYPGKVQRIYNFIDVPSAENSCFIRNTTINRNSPPTVGIFGRLVPIKRVDLFIEAIALLQRQLHFPVKGIIVGDGPLRASLEARVNVLGLDRLIEFKGFVHDTTKELRNLDALLMTSDHEGLPMVLLEALAQKVPIIAHSVGGIPEVLANGRAGILVENHTAIAYSEKIKWLLLYPQTAERQIESGFRHLSKNFCKQQNIEMYQELYKRLNN